MALITNIAAAPTNPIDQHIPPIFLNMTTRQFEWPNNYVVAVNGDNKSQLLTFKVKRTYDNIDLSIMRCILSYWTTWTDDGVPPQHSKGEIELTDKTIEGDYILYTWLLTINQTWKPGQCLFIITFYDIQDPTFKTKYPAGNEPLPTQQNGKWVYIEGQDVVEYNYYALSSVVGKFDILKAELGVGHNKLIFPSNDQERINKLEKVVGINNQDINYYDSLNYKIREIEQKLNENTLDKIYPISAIYANTDGSNPHTSLKFGEWELVESTPSKIYLWKRIS